MVLHRAAYFLAIPRLIPISNELDVAVYGNAVNKAVCFILPLMVASSAMVSVADDAELKYYESVLTGKSDGVYEQGDNLFIVSTAKYDKRRTATRSNATDEAELGIVPLLKSWIIKRTLERDGTPDPKTDFRKFTWEFLDKVCPGWMFPEWSVSAEMRTIVDDAKDGKYSIVMVTKKSGVQANILADYHARFDDDFALSYIRRVFNSWNEMDEGLAIAYRACGVPDLGDRSLVPADLMGEYDSVNKKLSEYLRSSKTAQSIRKDVEISKVPIVSSNTVVSVNPQGTEKVIKTEITSVQKIPRMQLLFLGCGVVSNTPHGRIESGSTAIRVAYDQQSTIDKKLTALKNALCDNPGDTELWNLYGRCMDDNGDKMAAIICYRNALKLKPDYEYPIVNLAKVYSELGYKRLGVGLALLARGTAKDKWSISESQKILFDPWYKDGQL